MHSLLQLYCKVCKQPTVRKDNVMLVSRNDVVIHRHCWDKMTTNEKKTFVTSIINHGVK